MTNWRTNSSKSNEPLVMNSPLNTDENINEIWFTVWHCYSWIPMNPSLATFSAKAACFHKLSSGNEQSRSSSPIIIYLILFTPPYLCVELVTCTIKQCIQFCTVREKNESVQRVTDSRSKVGNWNGSYHIESIVYLMSLLGIVSTFHDINEKKTFRPTELNEDAENKSKIIPAHLDLLLKLLVPAPRESLQYKTIDSKYHSLG